MWAPTTHAVPIELQPPALATQLVASSPVLATSMSMPTFTRASTSEDASSDIVIWSNDAVDSANHFCPTYLASIVPTCHLRPAHIVAIAFTFATIWSACGLFKIYQARRDEKTVSANSGLQSYTQVSACVSVDTMHADCDVQSNIVAKLIATFYGGAPSRSRTSSLDRDGASSTVPSASANHDIVLTVLPNTNHTDGDASNTTAARTQQQTESSTAHESHSTPGTILAPSLTATPIDHCFQGRPSPRGPPVGSRPCPRQCQWRTPRTLARYTPRSVPSISK